ncbi:MAG: flagellar export chaperone FliS [Desulfurivibrionaceae bacterium]|nr:flagellar export chaperone FliS [Desulfurivibrionaceae bacterium]
MYQNQQKACSTYKQNELKNLDPAEIVARLYQALGSALVTARDAIVDGDTKVQGEQVSRALAIITELHAALNMEEGGEISANLNDLYFYLTSEITQGNIKNDPEMLANAIRTVQPLTEAWMTLAANRKAEVGDNLAARRPAEKVERGAFQAVY